MEQKYTRQDKPENPGQQEQEENALMDGELK